MTLARILRARGRHGEVAAEVLTDFHQRLTQLRQVWLSDGRTPPRSIAVRSCWLHKGQAIFHFEGCDSIGDAEKLRGFEVQIPLAERVALPRDKHYVTDLIGCEVFERSGDPRPALTLLGSVRDVQFTGEDVAGTPLLVVQTSQGELLLPLADEICQQIDTAARRIEVVLPEGLSELNRE